MDDKSISHARGKGSINHNNRNHICHNVDPSRTQNNIFYAKEDLDDAYQKCFGQALENYNAKQKRSDRKIKDYYQHLFGKQRKDVVATASNKEKSFYEIVVGIGGKNTCAVGSPNGEIAAKILDEYARGFSERNPNFHVFNAVLHMDETTPHLHIDYIPVADGYKGGLETRNSQSVALKTMGFGKKKDSISEWRIQERKVLRELCAQYGLEISEETKGRGKTFTPDEYKQIRDEAKAELKADPEVFNEIKDELRADIEDDLLSEQQHLIGEVQKHRQEASDLEQQIKQQSTKLKEQVEKTKEYKNAAQSTDEVEEIWKRKKSGLGGRDSYTPEDSKKLYDTARSSASRKEKYLSYKNRAEKSEAALSETKAALATANKKIEALEPKSLLKKLDDAKSEMEVTRLKKVEQAFKLFPEKEQAQALGIVNGQLGDWDRGHGR